jgi:DNA-binding response OmpR family regulator
MFILDGMHIVLVEDNAVLAKSVNTVLKHEGYSTTLFDNGNTACTWLQSNSTSYDFVILDIMLPEMGGLEICKVLRKSAISVPILMLTSKGEVEDMVEGLDCGADDYLAKPFVIDELLARIRSLARRQPNVLESNMHLTPNVMVDFLSQKVFREGEEVHLTAKEFGILSYFAHHPNKVVTQQELYDHVFDFAEVQMSNTIEVHIKNLRKKLRTDIELPIVTLRNVGYRLDYGK